MMLASISPTAKSTPATRPAWASMPAATAPASTNLPTSAVSAKEAAVKAIMATAPNTTSPMPTHRSARS